MKRRFVDKAYGVRYEFAELALDHGRVVWRWNGRTRVDWYETRKQRDEKLANFRRRYRDSPWYRNHQPVDSDSAEENARQVG